MKINNLSDAKFKPLVIRMLKEFSQGLNSIKKLQSETKDILIEIKNNLQGNNSKVDETKNQINIWNIRKQKTTNQNKKKKKESKKNNKKKKEQEEEKRIQKV